MDQTIQELYHGYVRAMQFLVESLKKKASYNDGHSFPEVRIVSADEFPAWWESVCHDPDAKQRWLERFEDPGAAHLRAQKRIRENLAQVAFRRAA